MPTQPTDTNSSDGVPPQAWLAIAVVILAASLNLSFIAPIGAGLRLAASDAIAPLLGLALLWSARHAWRTLVPSSQVLIAAGLMTAVIAFGIAHGFARIGEVFPWSFLNRGAGWLVLLGYAGVGVVLVRSGNRNTHWFLASFVLTCAAIGTAALIAHIAVNILWPGYNVTFGWKRLAEDIAHADTGPLFDLAASQYFRLVGLYQNPNAFGLLTASGVIVMCADRQRTLPLPWAPVLMIILLTATYLSGSRSAWIGLALALSVLLYVNGLPWRRLVAALTVACAVVLAVPVLHELGAPFVRDLGIDVPAAMPPGVRRAHPSEIVFHTSQLSLTHRWSLIHAGLEMWRDNPVFGAGIGSFYHQQLFSGAENPSVLHSTGVWLLAETGSIGFLIAVSACGLILWKLAGALRRSESADSLSLLIAIATVTCFAAASVGMDSLYQRALWLFLGIGIGCVENRRKEEPPVD